MHMLNASTDTPNNKKIKKTYIYTVRHAHVPSIHRHAEQ